MGEHGSGRTPGEHPSDDELVELAIASLSGSREADLARHLGECAGCRDVYDEFGAAVDEVMIAAPVVAPPAGFESRVLDAVPRTLPPRRRRVQRLVAAAAVLGVLIGSGAAFGIDHWRAPHARSRTAPQVSSPVRALVDADGRTVGTAAPSVYLGRRVLALMVWGARPGTHYRCELERDDGSVLQAGEWWTGRSGDAAWMTPLPADVRAIRLVTDDGGVWSRAPVHR